MPTCKRYAIRALVLVLMLSGPVSLRAQVQLNPELVQGFSTQFPLKAFRLVSSLPATCTVGMVVYKTTATTGVYVCTSTNTWTVVGSSGGGGGAVSCATISLTASPTYDASSATSLACFSLTLGATAVTGGTITDPSSGTGQVLTFYIAQDGTGGRTFTCPTGVNGCPVNFDTTASGVTTLTVLYLGSSTYQVLAIENQSSAATCHYFYEAVAGGNNYQSICAPSTLGGNTVMTLPGVTGLAAVIVGTPADGDCAKFVVSGGLTNVASNGSICSAGGGSFDRTKLNITEEFFPRGEFIATGYAQLGWLKSGTGTESDIAGTANHPGQLQLQSGTTIADTLSWVLTGNSGVNLSPRLDASCACTSWNQTIVVGTDTLTPSITNTTVQIGWTATTAMRPNNSIIVRYSDQSISCTTGSNSTANWILELIDNAGANTCVDTTVAVAANTYYTFYLYSTSLGTVGLQVSTTGGAFSSAVTANTHVPAVSLRPIFSVETHNTTAKRLIEDLWHLEINGLTR